VGNSGGIGFWWRDINVSTTSFTAHHFAANICDHNNPTWRAIWPKQENKHLTWSLMSLLKLESSTLCIMFGDFNEIVSLDEKDGGMPRGERLMDAFRGAIDGCGLRDLGFQGSSFTWHRGNSPETFMRERLDRFLGDSDWCSVFQWFEECEEVVAEAWASCINEQTTTRVSVCVEKLTSWVARCFGNVKKRIKDIENKLKVAQARTPNARMLHEYSSLVAELDNLHRLKESYWHAQARVNELRDGDKIPLIFTRRCGDFIRINPPCSMQSLRLVISNTARFWRLTEDLIRVIVGVAYGVPNLCLKAFGGGLEMDQMFASGRIYWLGRMGNITSVDVGARDEEQEAWRIIWKLGGPLKLNHLLWQMCKVCAASKQELFRRRITGDDLCGVCADEVESIIHVLFYCRVTQDVWNNSCFQSVVDDSPNSSFRSKLVWLEGKLDCDELRVLCAMAWSLWFRRNKLVHEGLDLNTSQTAVGYVKLVEDYCIYAKKVFSSQPRRDTLSLTAWQRPSEGSEKRFKQCA
uniref:GATA-type domain-containing protein n=1 Tax=Chenopodium quinoa TaxID=63459 RepID=A0A803L0D3_CHEQI